MSVLQDERGVKHAGEAAQPSEAHHPEDGHQLGGRRARRPCEHQGQHVAKVNVHTPETHCVPVGSADEGHRVPEDVKTTQ